MNRGHVAEFLGSAFLLSAIVGSGVMAQRLTHDAGLMLLVNSLATGAVLCAAIAAFGAVSGAHFNPIVTLGMAVRGVLAWHLVPGYIMAQIGGALFGVGVANVMFDLPVFLASHHARHAASQWVGEVVATFGLIAVIVSCSRLRPTAVPYAIGAYIVGAYWFTSSTSFANPAVTIARALTDTFAGIAPQDVTGFILAQLIGGACAVALCAWLIPAEVKRGKEIVAAS